MKDLLAVTKFYNLRLRREIEKLGLPTYKLANAIGISPARFYRLGRLQESPFGHDGYTRDAIKVAEFFGLEPSELFPASLYGLDPPPWLEREYSSAEFWRALITRPEPAALPSFVQEEMNSLLVQKEMRKALEKSFAGLTEREARVLKMRFGLEGGREHTLLEVAAVFSVSRVRIGQIEAKALRKLRHPKRNRNLRPFVCLNLEAK